ncbi:MAG: hypothetical protein H6924_06790 [Alphaproteobacteria bacterium]|nr:hypothetical protein [Alphaproteobacteria bacterium]
MKHGTVRIRFLLVIFAVTLGLAPISAIAPGGPVAYTVMGGIKRLPNHGRPAQRVPFPEIRDWNSLQITLRRDACLGDCPIYHVKIAGDGSVEYQGDAYVAVPGRHIAKISTETVRSLFDAFKKAHFFWLFDTYRAKITDNPEYQIGISFDGNSKIVTDYVGSAIGMPKEVTDLEKLIDVLAGTAKWVSGNDQTFASLQSEGWNFRAANDANAKLLAGAASASSPELLNALLAAGVPAANPYGCVALKNAVRDPERVRKLIDAGAPVHAEFKDEWPGACNALSNAARVGAVDSLRLILAQHPDVNWRSKWDDEVGESALKEAATSDPDPKTRQSYVEIVKLLLAAGASVKDPPNADPLLRGVNNAEIATLLIQAGADVNARWLTNTTPLMWVYDPDTARVLLENGADPYARDDDGKTALDRIQNYKAAAVAVIRKWMSDHPKVPD